MLLHYLCLCVTLYACNQVISCKHVHPVVRVVATTFLITRMMRTTEGMCVQGVVYVAYCMLILWKQHPLFKLFSPSMGRTQNYRNAHRALGGHT